MVFSKQMIHAAAVACFSMSSVLAAAAAAPSGVPTTGTPAWIDQQVQEIQPKPDERRLDEIGWARDIRTAEKLAKENNRPIFLFTHDGRMGTGRC